MPIEFACESCTQLLRVPDGSGGQSCQCPACQEIVLIPDPQSIPQVALENKTETQTGKLKIACPKCQFELICPRNLLGTRGQCRNCQYIFTIAETNSAAQTERNVTEPGLIFNCPECDQLFEGQAEMEGRKGKCHACGAVFAIELKTSAAPTVAKPTVAKPRAPSRPSPKQRPSKPTVARQTVNAKPAARQPKRDNSKPASPTPQRASRPSLAATQTSQLAASIRFACTQCQGVMEVPHSTAGRNTECPYCQQLLTIPQQSTIDLSSPSTSPNYFAPHVEKQPQVFPAATDGVDAGRAGNNPYASPRLEPNLPANSSDEWSARTRNKIRGLTFGNAFQLTFDSLFPYCLVASVLFVLVGGFAFAMVMGSLALAGFTVQAVELDPKSTAGLTIIYGALGISMVTAVILVTAVYCMTCNTALHMVRGRKISGEVLFGTGESYGGMLVILFGWTVFNIMQRVGVPWIVQSLQDSGQGDTAVVIGVVILAVMFILQSALTLLLAFVPYALLDGQSLPDAIATSCSVFLGNFLTVFAVTICGWLLYTFVSVITCGLGFIVFIGAILYLNAAIYHLALRNRTKLSR